MHGAFHGSVLLSHCGAPARAPHSLSVTHIPVHIHALAYSPRTYAHCRMCACSQCRVHPAVGNPNNSSRKGYWWTCVAMPVTDTDRVIAPAKESITPCTPWPYGAHTLNNVTFRGPNVDGCAARNGAEGGCAWQQDMSFLGNIPSAHDFFFRIYKPQQPYIAHTREDGYVFLLNLCNHFWLILDSPCFTMDMVSCSSFFATGSYLAALVSQWVWFPALHSLRPAHTWQPLLRIVRLALAQHSDVVGRQAFTGMFHSSQPGLSLRNHTMRRATHTVSHV